MFKITLFKAAVAWTLLSLLAFACTKKATGLIGDAGPEGPPGLSTGDGKSNISGYVRTFDEFNRDSADYGNVTVTTRSATTLYSGVTDNTGKYHLDSLPSGSYRLMFNRPGFDSIGINVNHVAGNQTQFIGEVGMTQSLTGKLTDQTITLVDDAFNNPFKGIQIVTTIGGIPVAINSPRYLNILLGRSPDVTPDNALDSNIGYQFSLDQHHVEEDMYFQTSPVSLLHNGDTVYVKTILKPTTYLGAAWFDPTTYRTNNYPYLGDSISRYFIFTTH